MISIIIIINSILDYPRTSHINLSTSELWKKSVTNPHKLLFSATLSHDPEKLKKLFLFKPILFTSNKSGSVNVESTSAVINSTRTDQYSFPKELEQKFCIIEDKLRPLTMFSLIKDHNWNRFICFTNTATAAHRLSYLLQKLFDKEKKIEELSSNLKPVVRRSVVDQFVSGEIHGLVCTDALARGIDIPNIDVVISYDPPRHITTYIHRIGRTARAGNHGTSLCMVTATELEKVNVILNPMKEYMTFNELCVSSNTEEMYALKYKNALLQLQIALEKEKKNTNNTDSITTHKEKKVSMMDKLKMKIQNEVVSTNAPHVPQSWLLPNYKKQKKFGKFNNK